MFTKIIFKEVKKAIKQSKEDESGSGIEQLGFRLFAVTTHNESSLHIEYRPDGLSTEVSTWVKDADSLTLKQFRAIVKLLADYRHALHAELELV
jgi:hypothetical protein